MKSLMPIPLAERSMARVCGPSLVGIEGSSLLVPVVERSKARVYGRLRAGIAVSNPAGVMDVCML